jgi:hypothetical protein
VSWMKREIKFRAWNKIDKTMYTDAINNCKDTLGMVLKHPQIYDVMQFTGLNDKSSVVEIYNGDILRYYSDARMAVPTKDGGWKLEGNSQVEERTVVEYVDALGAYMVHGGSSFLHEINDKSEVIGNKFEHPELLGTPA